MRTIQTNDILKNKYSIVNNEVIETENGEYYNQQIAKQIMISEQQNKIDSAKQLKEMDKKQKQNAVKKICIDKYSEAKSENTDINIWEKEPQKEYEIYRLKLDTEELMLINTKYLPDSKEKEVYYDKNIAMKIYDNMFQLEQNIENSFPELMEMCQGEIAKIQETIHKLKKEDEEKYKEAVNTYHTIYDSGILETMKNNFKQIKTEKDNLKQQLEKSNHIIQDLSKKLQVALNKVEELQNQKFGFWSRIFSRLKTKRLNEKNNNY